VLMLISTSRVPPMDIMKESAPCVASIEDGGILHRKQAHGRCGRMQVSRETSIKQEIRER
jgi:hypothetical protein